MATNGHVNGVSHEKVDVLIVGAGPAGLMMAEWMAKCGVKTRIVDKRGTKVCKCIWFLSTVYNEGPRFSMVRQTACSVVHWRFSTLLNLVIVPG